MWIRLLESFSSSKAPSIFLGVTTLNTFLANCSLTPCLLKRIDSCVESLQPQCYWQLTIDQAYFFFRYQFTKLLRTDLSLLGLVRNGWTCFIVTFWLNLKIVLNWKCDSICLHGMWNSDISPKVEYLKVAFWDLSFTFHLCSSFHNIHICSMSIVICLLTWKFQMLSYIWLHDNWKIFKETLKNVKNWTMFKGLFWSWLEKDLPCW